MAKYWVHGTGNWTDNTNHWADSSGGAEGADIPTATDDVVINTNSGFGSGGTLTLDGEVNTCCSFTSIVGVPYTIDGSFLNVYGDVVLESTLVIDLTFGGGIYLTATDSSAHTVDFAAATLDCGIYTDTNSTYTMLSSAVFRDFILIVSGDVDFNGFNFTCSIFAFLGVATTIHLRSGVFTLTGDDTVIGTSTWSALDNNPSFYCGTSTIKFTNTNANTKSFLGANFGYNKLWITGAGTGKYIIIGDETFTDCIKMDTPPKKLTVTGTSTVTVGDFKVSGTLGNLMTIDSNDEEVGAVNGISRGSGTPSGYSENDVVTVVGGGNDATILLFNVSGGYPYDFSVITRGSGYSIGTGIVTTYGGGGTGFDVDIQSIYGARNQFILSSDKAIISCDYLSVRESNAIGDAIWYAGSHSTDVDNNDGWLFEDAPSGTAYDIFGWIVNPISPVSDVFGVTMS